MIARYPITPVPKPRQTQSDKWKKRPAVLRYRAFADQVRLRGVTVLNGDVITFVMPMPKSWGSTKERLMTGEPHQQKPDWDNLAKSLCDAMYKDDSHLWNLHVKKIWGVMGEIIIERSESR